MKYTLTQFEQENILYDYITTQTNMNIWHQVETIPVKTSSSRIEELCPRFSISPKNQR